MIPEASLRFSNSLVIRVWQWGVYGEHEGPRVLEDLQGCPIQVYAKITGNYWLTSRPQIGQNQFLRAPKASP